MLGAIMPDPLAMPLMTTGTPSISASALAPLGKVSVVIIALAASGHALSERRSWSPGRASHRRSVGNCSPITPVEEM